MSQLAVTDHHERAVEALRRSYAAIPPGTPVRLAKQTSNLFRFREPTAAPGLDVSGFNRVLAVDPDARTADVQGMTTYEDLVDATLPHGLMPLVVPQLKTITLGGAVTGLGIESTSFRNGLPHESVLEMQIITGAGEVVTATPDGEHSDLFWGFPNSYGTLGYALKLKIELEPVKPYVRLRHLRFDDAGECAAKLAELSESREHEGDEVHFLDGTFFGPREMYLTLGTFTDTAPYVSDYTGQHIYYRSIQQRSIDFLTIRDYLWRWDTDWFWCSRALGVQNPLIRRVWPKSAKRSDVYRKLVAYEKRYQFKARIDRWTGKPPREDVIQDIEVPAERLPEFLEFFHDKIGMSPVWLCPLRARHRWPLYPLKPGVTYVNAGFWGTVPLQPGQMPEYHNRLIERKVAQLDGHKSLYSTAFYSREEFWRHYDGETYRRLKDTYDPDARLLDLYDKCVRGR
ncbi:MULTISPECIES: FAD-binding oxidoreductase [Thermomonospora]|uniref:Delta(24)-sterol reductase n=1 Tax=Thermomonospora curvata (strain ATCC 19995 / DSM 43183 / JCM 3096 / KCTC 9072 / NBRC 15933 / NCIMB 10081 / Henssen B9) TaxID=471852 RepID=D1ABB3_THECD|nr:MULTISPECIES: FAD-binding oxidoreductase [Thermomonospora]ACY97149.1 FAD linked oxidase domain protein [Thermomonospora curvata DSM 43183]PKK15011.1 MAG: FAD-binding oxidoreductase [Thermomonospora sp. CIF 1]